MRNIKLANQLIGSLNGKFELINENKSNFVSILKKEDGSRYRIRSAENEIIFYESETNGYEYFIGEVNNEYVLLRHKNSYEVEDELTNVVIHNGDCIPFRACKVLTYNNLLKVLL